MSEFETGAAAPAADAPVVAPATTTNAPASTADQVAIPEGETPEAKPERTFTQKELEEILQKRLSKAERKIERDARDREERTQQRIQREVEERLARSQPPKAQSEGEPNPADFKDWDEYNAAKVSYLFRQEMKGYQQQTQEQRQQEARQQTEMQRASQVQKALSSAAQKYEDFNEVVYSPDVSFTEPMAIAISKLKDGGEVAYFLASNLAEVHRIAALDPVDQVWEIKAIEAKLSAPPSTTKTPPPITPTNGPASVKKNTFDLPWAEFVKQRRKEVSRR